VFWYFTSVLDYLQHLQKYHHSKKNKVNMLKSGQNDEDSDEDSDDAEKWPSTW
jgi:hypothetical protein